MVCDLEPADYGDLVWRVGHAPDPCRFTNSGYADTTGRFDGRWGDPDASYRVLYASANKVGAFVEPLGNFRADRAG